VKYILDEYRNPVPCPDVRKWAAWYEKADRVVALDKLFAAEVSTVFLGLDMGIRTDEKSYKPYLWETMVFGGKLDGEMQRYTSMDDALTGHREMVDRVRKEG